jgi:branched-chain amino acid transport system permease protein
MERAAYKPLRTAPRMSVMISAIGVSYLLQNLMLVYHRRPGQASTPPSRPWISDSVSVLGATTKRVTVITPLLVVVLVIALDPADQPHQDRHGHAGGLPGF